MVIEWYLRTARTLLIAGTLSKQCASSSVHLLKKLYFTPLSRLSLIFFHPHPANFCGNLSLRMFPGTVTDPSFATCFSIWLLYHVTYHFSFHRPPPLNLCLTPSYQFPLSNQKIACFFIHWIFFCF